MGEVLGGSYQASWTTWLESPRVDVYAYVDKCQGYCEIQCKGKDYYTKVQLTEAEIDTEMMRALKFEPELKLLIFATTAN